MTLFRLIGVLLLLSCGAGAADISFSRQLAPLLSEKCVECHREAKSKGNYRLDTFESLLKAGDSGEPALTPGRPDASQLYQLLIAPDESDRMPKKADPLSRDEILLVQQWIAQGAKFDGKDKRQLISELGPPRSPIVTPAKYPRPLPVTALVLNGDGRRIMTSGYGEVLLWDSTTLKLAGRIQGLPERIFALAYAPQGNLLAVGGGTPGRTGEAWLMNAAEPKSKRRLLVTPDTIQCMAVSRDGKMLAVGGTDNHVRLLDLPTGKLRWNIEPHADWVTALAFAPDGTQLASASRDRAARLIDTKNGEITTTCTNHEVAVLSITFEADGKHVISGDAAGNLRRWTLDGSSDTASTMRPAREPILQLLQFGARTYAAIGNGLVMELDVPAKKVLRTFTSGTARADAIALMLQPLTLLAAHHDGEVRLWDVKEGKERAKFTAAP